MSDVVFNLDNYDAAQVAAILQFQELVNGFQTVLTALAEANVPIADALAFAGIEIPAPFMPVIEMALRSNAGSADETPSAQTA